ncbi:MAG TPA: hypothetical protein PLJ00_00650 [Chitinophagales bacterium]|nr:hypothetical protein [Chitinophagales bacterium]HRG26366.1 hypothetical protein [Chitinophagales bacterium]HRG85367.1 hypothetical protein [Chitinophagales bacterium]HRH52927.1 hypothetical protein [Chitinophagales bacterium]
MKKLVYASMLLLVISSGCKVAEKEFREGNYDEAINICIKKLIDNPDKVEYILLLEEAFVRANGEDLDYIKALNTDGSPDRWEEIYNVYEKIYGRQLKIKRLLPLYVGTEERDAEFKFADALDGMNTAKKNAAAYWYADASLKLKSNDVYKAREAYYELQKIERFYNDYKDADDLMKKAKEIGTNDVVFKVENMANASLNYDVTKAINQINIPKSSGSWYIVHSSVFEKGVEMTIQLNIRKIEAYPEKVSTNQYEESKQIIDGYEYVYDNQGNIVKDSLGNPIKEPDYKTVTAYVSETWQEKVATVSGEVVYLNKNGEVIRSFPVRADAVFKNYYAAATGYAEALTPQSKEKLGGKPLPFPYDDQMLIDAVNLLENEVRSITNANNDEYLNL